MNRLILIIGLLLLVANILCGFILTAYPLFNATLDSVVILFTTILLFLVGSVKLSDAFYISLLGLFSVLGVVEFVLGLFSPASFANHWFLIVVILLSFFDAVILLIATQVTTVTRAEARYMVHNT